MIDCDFDTLIKFLVPLAAVASAVAAVFAAFIAHWQVKLARQKSKQDLFDRRLVIFEAAKDFLWFVPNSSESRHVHDTELMKYLSIVKSSFWLFDERTSIFLIKTVHERYRKLDTLRFEIDSQSGVALQEKIRESQELKSWFYREFNELDERMKEFLRMSEA